MTTTQTHASTAESTLRSVLLTNTALSTTTGLIGLVFAGPVAQTLGVDMSWLIRLLGGGLVGFAGAVFLVARSPRPVVQRWSREISYADFGWVIGTAAVIALGWLSVSGAAIMAGIAVAVLALGLSQYRLCSVMTSESAT